LHGSVPSYECPGARACQTLFWASGHSYELCGRLFVVETVKFEEDGVSTHKDTTFDLLRANDKQQYGIDDRPDGFAYANYGVQGDMKDVVSTADMDAFEATVDTGSTAPTDPAEVRVVTQELVR